MLTKGLSMIDSYPLSSGGWGGYGAWGYPAVAPAIAAAPVAPLGLWWKK